jgi:hypothetical protein
MENRNRIMLVIGEEIDSGSTGEEKGCLSILTRMERRFGFEVEILGRAFAAVPEVDRGAVGRWQRLSRTETAAGSESLKSRFDRSKGRQFSMGSSTAC